MFLCGYFPSMELYFFIADVLYGMNLAVPKADEARVWLGHKWHQFICQSLINSLLDRSQLLQPFVSSGTYLCATRSKRNTPKCNKYCIERRFHCHNLAQGWTAEGRTWVVLKSKLNRYLKRRKPTATLWCRKILSVLLMKEFNQLWEAMRSDLMQCHLLYLKTFLGKCLRWSQGTSSPYHCMTTQN